MDIAEVHPPGQRCRPMIGTGPVRALKPVTIMKKILPFTIYYHIIILRYLIIEDIKQYFQIEDSSFSQILS